MQYTPWIKDAVEAALREDLGMGDVTSELVVGPEAEGTAEIICREQGVMAGIDVAREVFLTIDNRLSCVSSLKDGDRVSNGTVILGIQGPLLSILKGERTALNFLQRMSGIATITSKWADLIREYPVQLVDTRKTTPGLRRLEKYAVTVGGGRNHRLNLSDGVLIKDNHIIAAGGIKKAMDRVKNKAPLTLKTEVEVTSLGELEEAIEAGADLVMLDNMAPEMMKKAVEISNGRVPLEASGNITAQNIARIAATGVNYISSGALTYAARALDMTLLLSESGPAV